MWTTPHARQRASKCHSPYTALNFTNNQQRDVPNERKNDRENLSASMAVRCDDTQMPVGERLRHSMSNGSPVCVCLSIFYFFFSCSFLNVQLRECNATSKLWLLLKLSTNMHCKRHNDTHTRCHIHSILGKTRFYHSFLFIFWGRFFSGVDVYGATSLLITPRKCPAFVPWILP